MLMICWFPLDSLFSGDQIVNPVVHFCSGQHHDLDLWLRLAQCQRHFLPVHFRHNEIYECNIRIQTLRRRQSGLSVLRLTHDLQAWFQAKDHDQSFADYCMIVDNEKTDDFRHGVYGREG